MVVGPVNNTVAFVSPQQSSVNPATEPRNTEQIQPRQAPPAESQRAENNRDESARRSETRTESNAAPARNDNETSGRRGEQLDVTV